MSLFKRVTNIVRGKILDAQQQEHSLDVDALLAEEMSKQSLKRPPSRSQRSAPVRNQAAETDESISPDGSSQPKKRTL